jgi:hypothetical protein
MDRTAAGAVAPHTHTRAQPKARRPENIVGAPLAWDSKLLEAYNIERVRSYMEKHPCWLHKQIALDLNLHPRTVAKAVRMIRDEEDGKRPWARHFRAGGVG